MQIKRKLSARHMGILTVLSLIFAISIAAASSHVWPNPTHAASFDHQPVEATALNRPPYQQPNNECDGTQTGLCEDGTCTHSPSSTVACIYNGGVAEWYGEGGPRAEDLGIEVIESEQDVTGPAPSVVENIPENVVVNGNFEFGFYNVPQLGFEPPDSGAVPNGWGWYKNRAYGKFTIFDNQTLGLECPNSAVPPPSEPSPEDSIFAPIPGVTVNEGAVSALGLHMQSTDQQDARLGVYQTVDVVPGQAYRFSMSGTLQIQSGATTLQPDDPEAPEEAPNHTLELYFDQTGNTDWRAIPHKRWTIIEWPEEKLEFKVSEDDDDLADIESYETYVTAQSNQMTIFITFWRKWANWRTGIASIDCVSLVPVDRIPPATPTPAPLTASGASSTDVQPAAAGVQPAVGLPVTGLTQEVNQPQTAQPKPQPQPAETNQTNTQKQNTAASDHQIQPQTIPPAEAPVLAEPEASNSAEVGQPRPAVEIEPESQSQATTGNSRKVSQAEAAESAPNEVSPGNLFEIQYLFLGVIALFVIVLALIGAVTLRSFMTSR